MFELLALALGVLVGIAIVRYIPDETREYLFGIIDKRVEKLKEEIEYLKTKIKD
jgi:hypothetical protein